MAYDINPLGISMHLKEIERQATDLRTVSIPRRQPKAAAKRGSWLAALRNRLEAMVPGWRSTAPLNGQ